MFDILQGHALELVAVIVAAVAGVSLLDDALADIVKRVPVVGPILAPIMRRMSARFRDWMRTRVPASAEAAVKQAEGALGGTDRKAGAEKKAAAVAVLDKAEPGLLESELEREIEAAFQRLIGAERLAQHDRPRTPDGGVTP